MAEASKPPAARNAVRPTTKHAGDGLDTSRTKDQNESAVMAAAGEGDELATSGGEVHRAASRRRRGR